MRTRSKKRNKINVITLGCSKNIYDSEIIIKQLEASKKNVVHEENGNIVVINTCGFIDNAKTHIHAGSKLTATSAHATFYLRNGDLIHSAQTLAHSMKVTKLEVALSIAIGRELENVRNVVMRDKKVWISAFENHYGKAIVVLELCNQPNQL